MVLAAAPARARIRTWTIPVPAAYPAAQLSCRTAPALTVADLMQKDGSIGTVSIKRIGLSAKVYEGAKQRIYGEGCRPLYRLRTL